jgi:hypothetical protein
VAGGCCWPGRLKLWLNWLGRNQANSLFQIRWQHPPSDHPPPALRAGQCPSVAAAVGHSQHPDLCRGPRGPRSKSSDAAA